MLTIKCDYCGKEFNRFPSQIGKRNFCCPKCRTLGDRKINMITFRENHGEIIVDSKKHGQKIILFDLDDLELINKYGWGVRFDGYNFYGSAFDVYNPKAKKLLIFHRLITNCPDDKIIDHINRNTLDNRKINLRICEQRDNMLNTPVKITNKSKNKNIYYSNTYKRWVFKIKRKDLQIEKYFKTYDEAVKFKNEYIKNIEYYQ